MLYSLSDICDAVAGKTLLNSETGVKSVCIDSRLASDGALFFAINGERVDGHNYLLSAAENGAVAAVVSKEPEGQLLDKLKDLNFGVIMVEDSVKALSKLSAWHRSNLDVKVVGVTGSAGKTTTKDMTTSVLRKGFDVISTRGNYNNEIGVPLTLLSIEEHHQVAVVEMAMRGFGQIKELCEYAKPVIGVITNIGDSHIEFLKSRQNIAKAKWELVEAIPIQGYAVLNGDDENLLSLIGSANCQVVLYGIENLENDVRATDIVQKPDGTSFRVYVSDKVRAICPQTEGFESCEFFVPLPGRHNVLNALASVTTGLLMGIGRELIAEGLFDLVRSPMRMSFIEGRGGYTVIDDSYNANPPAMKCALDAMKDFSGERRKVAILGGMVDLGDYSDEGHRKVGEHVISTGVDLLITTGELGSKIADAALDLGMGCDRVFRCRDNDEAVQTAMDVLLPEDVVLIKGSRAIRTDEIVTKLAR